MGHDLKSIEFIGAGNAVFTVANPDGVHYTFKVRQPAADKPHFVSLLTGPENTRDYTYIGVYDPLRFTLRITKKSKMTDASLPVNVFRWAVAVLSKQAELPAGYTIQHEGKCCRCGRTLTTPESLDTGVGPECATVLGKNWSRDPSRSQVSTH